MIDFRHQDEYLKDLEEKYHHLFETDENGKILCGIEVFVGWRRIVERLLETFERIRIHNTHVLNPKHDPARMYEEGYTEMPCIPGPDHAIKIFEIKQKHAKFRCYVTVTEDPLGIAKEEVQWAIAHSAGQAELTCEVCGRIGNRDGTAPEPSKIGWLRIVCDECKKLWFMRLAEKAATDENIKILLIKEYSDNPLAAILFDK